MLQGFYDNLYCDDCKKETKHDFSDRLTAVVDREKDQTRWFNVKLVYCRVCGMPHLGETIIRK